MNLQTIVSITELVAAIAVVVSLVYLAVQVRQGNRVNSANARHAISQFALDISVFKAGHADRIAKIMEGKDLSPGDLQFRWWNHMLMFLHAETYFHHYEMKLMPENHWLAYARFFRDYIQSPGIHEFWDDIGPGFSKDFADWVTVQLSQSAPRESEQVA